MSKDVLKNLFDTLEPEVTETPSVPQVSTKNPSLFKTTHEKALDAYDIPVSAIQKPLKKETP